MSLNILFLLECQPATHCTAAKDDKNKLTSSIDWLMFTYPDSICSAFIMRFYNYVQQQEDTPGFSIGPTGVAELTALLVLNIEKPYQYQDI